MKIQSTERKYADSPAKKKFQVQQSVKKIMLRVFQDMKGTITIDSLEKGSTVNSASYYQLLKQNSPYLLNDLSYMDHIKIFAKNENELGTL